LIRPEMTMRVSASRDATNNMNLPFNAKYPVFYQFLPPFSSHGPFFFESSPGGHRLNAHLEPTEQIPFYQDRVIFSQTAFFKFALPRASSTNLRHLRLKAIPAPAHPKRPSSFLPFSPVFSLSQAILSKKPLPSVPSRYDWLWSCFPSDYARFLLLLIGKFAQSSLSFSSLVFVLRLSG